MQKKITEDVKKNVLTIFDEYLEKSSLRKTPERYFILEEVYDTEGRFKAEDLYIQLKNKNFRVSKATVYNTLELLFSCNLVVKYRFNELSAEYERCFGNVDHYHIICQDCDRIIEIEEVEPAPDKRINSGDFEFDVQQKVVNVYAKCAKHGRGHCDLSINEHKN
jgi:Fur family ferric uptake transcriptional regulator